MAKVDPKHEAKYSMLKKLKDMMTGANGEDAIQKVTVAAPDKESLKAGLEKAKMLTDKMPMGDEESPEHEASESPEEEASEHDVPSDQELASMSREDLIALLKKS